MLASVEICFRFTLFFIIAYFYHVITVYFHFFLSLSLFSVYNPFAMYILFAFRDIGKMIYKSLNSLKDECPCLVLSLN